MVKNPKVGGEPVGYFTRVAVDWNSGLQRTNSASGQSAT